MKLILLNVALNFSSWRNVKEYCECIVAFELLSFLLPLNVCMSLTVTINVVFLALLPCFLLIVGNFTCYAAFKLHTID